MIWSYYGQEVFTANTKVKHNAHIFSHFTFLTHYFKAFGEKKQAQTDVSMKSSSDAKVLSKTYLLEHSLCQDK